MLRLLGDREWHSFEDCVEAGAGRAVSQRITDLRNEGYQIDTHTDGPHCWYRLRVETAAAPRTPRLRLYVTVSDAYSMARGVLPENCRQEATRAVRRYVRSRERG